VGGPCPEVTEEEEAAGDGEHGDEDLHEENLSAAGVMVIDDDPSGVDSNLHLKKETCNRLL
jgi:hypothetical protein